MGKHVGKSLPGLTSRGSASTIGDAQIFCKAGMQPSDQVCLCVCVYHFDNKNNEEDDDHHKHH